MSEAGLSRCCPCRALSAVRDCSRGLWEPLKDPRWEGARHLLADPSGITSSTSAARTVLLSQPRWSVAIMWLSAPPCCWS